MELNVAVLYSVCKCYLSICSSIQIRTSVDRQLEETNTTVNVTEKRLFLDRTSKEIIFVSAIRYIINSISALSNVGFSSERRSEII